MINLKSRRSRAAVLAAVALTLMAGIAEARVGKGGSFGSRGARTYDSAPATRTAPDAASPIQRSQIPNSGPAMQRPGMAPAQAAQPRRFGGGFMAGLFGAGLLGMLLGAGFFGGFSGLASILGFLIQVALVGLLVAFAIRWFRRRQQPALAVPQGYARQAAGSAPPAGGLGGALGSLGGLGAARETAPQRRPGVTDEIGIGPADFNAFERSLTEVQAAYSRHDVAALWTLATPEMAGYIQEELNDNAQNGVVNTVKDVSLLQGDLAEAWREGAADYATVAMRFSSVDATVDRATGRVVEGDPTRPVEATELWTFRRDRGGPWLLSAIQQA